MRYSRRQLIQAGTLAGTLAALPVFGNNSADPESIKAIAFDAFPIFDPRPIFALTEKLFPGRGQAINRDWRTRQFEYQWLRALAGRYADFWQATEDALVFAARQNNIALQPEQREQLMQAYLQLKPWPDVVAGLKTLREAKLKLVFLSNMTEAMLRTNAKESGIEHYFDHFISTDSARTYKPDHRAYQLGVDRLNLRKEEIVFAAFAGWDVAGATWFGYPTVWINRANFTTEQLGPKADYVSRDLFGLIEFAMQSQPA